MPFTGGQRSVTILVRIFVCGSFVKITCKMYFAGDITASVTQYFLKILKCIDSHARDTDT